MKTCNRCGEMLPLDEFYKEKRAPDGHYARCKTCHIAQVNGKLTPSRPKRTYRSPIGPKLPSDLETYYPMSHRRYRYAQYGLNHAQYDELYNKQEGKCAICGIPEEDTGRALSIDHCHDTLEVRGLLCGPCNSGIGMLRDNVDLLHKAIEYLKR